MSFSRDLLDQAELLANKEPRRPKQASLRRAVSTAYYALFHLMIEDSARALSPSSPAALRKVVQRAFQHGLMKTTCKDFVQANTAIMNNKQSALPTAVETMLAFPFDADLITVLTAFVDLQESRHKADYDLTEQWNRLDALNKILMVREAFAAWSNIRKTPNVAVFMTSLLIRKDWGR
ncbi:MAG: hypothetical protein ABSC25_00590 [Roseiarcus sp.]